MFGMNKQPRSKCSDCANFKTGTGYGNPVCYERQRVDGNPVAVSVKPNQKACFNFRAKMVTLKTINPDPAA